MCPCRRCRHRRSICVMSPSSSLVIVVAASLISLMVTCSQATFSSVLSRYKILPPQTSTSLTHSIIPAASVPSNVVAPRPPLGYPSLLPFQSPILSLPPGGKVAYMTAANGVPHMVLLVPPQQLQQQKVQQEKEEDEEEDDDDEQIVQQKEDEDEEDEDEEDSSNRNKKPSPRRRSECPHPHPVPPTWGGPPQGKKFLKRRPYPYPFMMFAPRYRVPSNRGRLPSQRRPMVYRRRPVMFFSPRVMWPWLRPPYRQRKKRPYNASWNQIPQQNPYPGPPPSSFQPIYPPHMQKGQSSQTPSSPRPASPASQVRQQSKTNPKDNKSTSSTTTTRTTSRVTVHQKQNGNQKVPLEKKKKSESGVVTTTRSPKSNGLKVSSSSAATTRAPSTVTRTPSTSPTGTTMTSGTTTSPPSSHFHPSFSSFPSSPVRLNELLSSPSITSPPRSDLRSVYNRPSFFLSNLPPPIPTPSDHSDSSSPFTPSSLPAHSPPQPSPTLPATTTGDHSITTFLPSHDFPPQAPTSPTSSLNTQFSPLSGTIWKTYPTTISRSNGKTNPRSRVTFNPRKVATPTKEPSGSESPSSSLGGVIPLYTSSTAIDGSEDSTATVESSSNRRKKKKQNNSLLFEVHHTFPPSISTSARGKNKTHPSRLPGRKKNKLFNNQSPVTTTSSVVDKEDDKATADQASSHLDSPSSSSSGFFFESEADNENSPIGGGTPWLGRPSIIPPSVRKPVGGLVEVAEPEHESYLTVPVVPSANTSTGRGEQASLPNEELVLHHHIGLEEENNKNDEEASGKSGGEGNHHHQIGTTNHHSGLESSSSNNENRSRNNSIFTNRTTETTTTSNISTDSIDHDNNNKNNSSIMKSNNNFSSIVDNKGNLLYPLFLTDSFQRRTSKFLASNPYYSLLPDYLSKDFSPD